MKYYKVHFSNEYGKKKGKYGIVKINEKINEYLLEDGISFPLDLFNNLTFYFEGDDTKSLADFQMTYFPWRVISEKFYKILKKYNNDESIYFYPITIGKNAYFIFHFNLLSDVLDEKQTIYSGDFIKTPVLNKLKIDKHIFNYREIVQTGTFCISEMVKLELEKNKISGCFFRIK